MGVALAYLLATNPKYKHKNCIIDITQHSGNISTGKQFYVSTGFIQHKSYKLIKKFFNSKPPTTNTVKHFNFIGRNKLITVKFKRPIGYMLDLEQFLGRLHDAVANSTYLDFIYNTYISDTQKSENISTNARPSEAFLLKLSHANGDSPEELSQIAVTNLIIADGTISNTSKLLKEKGYKVNINHKFSQGAEAILKIKASKLNKKQLKYIHKSIYFGISYEFAGYGFWIAPYKDNLLKIGYSIDQKPLLRRNYNINKLLDLAIKKSIKALSLKQKDVQIIHKGFKLIPLVTATQLYNITPYKHIWQIGDAGGFVGPLLLDGIYPGLNSVIDTYKEILEQEHGQHYPTNLANTKKQTMIWQPKISVPGNSIYTHRLLTYITTSAIIKEFYNFIFTARPITNIATFILERTIKKALSLLMKIKKENL